MDIRTFRKIVRDTRAYSDMKPCKEGIRWLMKMTRGLKNTDQFFEKCKTVENERYYEYGCLKYAGCPHGYLIYIFKYCLDWTAEKTDVFGFKFDSCGENYHKFLEEHFNVKYTAEIPIPVLCDALKRAFH